MTIYELQPGTEKTLTIKARDRYSEQRVKLMANASYQVFCKEDQHWWDFLIRTTPKGYTHGPANLLGTRVNGAPIFCLCAALLDPGVEDNDKTVFQLKTGEAPHELRYNEDRILCFFANDTKKWEWNNFGSIEVLVKRIN